MMSFALRKASVGHRLPLASSQHRPADAHTPPNDPSSPLSETADPARNAMAVNDQAISITATAMTKTLA